MRRLAGVFCLLAGTFIVAIQLLWTTAEPRNTMGLPEKAAAALVFILGLTGLALLYGGWQLLRRRR